MKEYPILKIVVADIELFYRQTSDDLEQKCEVWNGNFWDASFHKNSLFTDNVYYGQIRFVKCEKDFVPPQYTNKIYTTIGIYPNSIGKHGDCKFNGVSSKNIVSHIEYNTILRPGRTLVIDDEIVYVGWNCSVEQIANALKNANIQKQTRDTAPYN